MTSSVTGKALRKEGSARGPGSATAALHSEQAGTKKKSPTLNKTGDLVKRRLPTLPLAQYHRRDEA